MLPWIHWLCVQYVSFTIGWLEKARVKIIREWGNYNAIYWERIMVSKPYIKSFAIISRPRPIVSNILKNTLLIYSNNCPQTFLISFDQLAPYEDLEVGVWCLPWCHAGAGCNHVIIYFMDFCLSQIELCGFSRLGLRGSNFCFREGDWDH